LVVCIDREAKRNAIDVETAQGIDAALNRLDDDPALWVGVLTGTPAVFSAGSDIRDGLYARTERGGEYGLIRRKRIKPLVAAVEGPAFGGGFEIALACDLVVASATARFALPETRRGLIASSGALLRLSRVLPAPLAAEILIAGGELDANRAYTFGLVNRVTEPGGALQGAVELAEQVCRNSPVAVRATLAALAEQREQAESVGWAATQRALTAISGSADAVEGVAAFFEKREPIWPAH
jgi:enoyl-CoA hydratase/carnithine racemase